jgi:hypothetical protein
VPKVDLAISNQVSGIGFQLSALSNQQPGIRYQVSGFSFQLSALCFFLPTANCQLPTLDL